MKVTEQGFADWGTWLHELAATVCEGRILAVLEGGYDLDSLGSLAASHVQALSGQGGR
jgi:acetoin utilization deacetylase AcuC-like enzyme